MDGHLLFMRFKTQTDNLFVLVYRDNTYCAPVNERFMHLQLGGGILLEGKKRQQRP